MLEAEDAAQRAGVALVVGTSGLVYPAAALPRVAAEAGAFVAEVNPVATPHSPLADLTLRAGAAEVLPRVVAVLRQGGG
jgi:NAD-dependent deacetylase